MNPYNFDDVYATLCGEVHGEYAVPGVENAYYDGGECDRLYEEMSSAYERLRDRLGVIDEDMDAEIVINSLLQIQALLCKKIFRYGQSLH